MRKIFTIWITLVLILLVNSCQKEEYNTESQTDYDKEILDAVNAHRVSIGLNPLAHDDFLWQVANTHSENMAEGSVPFGHDGLTERYDQIIAEFGNGSFAENVANGQGTAAEVVESWLGSIGHKENMEGNYNMTGLSAIKSSDGKWYYTQIFFKPNP